LSSGVRGPRSAFKGFRFPPEIIVLAVRWYLRYSLSYRDLEERLAERGVEVDHVTVFRGFSASRHCCGRGAAVPPRRRQPLQVDETYVKVAGRWRYVYRAVDQHGQIIESTFHQDATPRRRVGFSRPRSVLMVSRSRS